MFAHHKGLCPVRRLYERVDRSIESPPGRIPVETDTIASRRFDVGELPVGEKLETAVDNPITAIPVDLLGDRVTLGASLEGVFDLT